MKRILIIILAILLVAVYVSHCSAQIWQNFKGARFVNESDTTDQLAIEGSFYYDDQLRGFYGRDRWGWKLFNIGAGGGGGNFWKSDGTTETFNGSTIIY